MIETNVYGPKRVTEAFIPLLNSETGRIVNVGSGMGSKFHRDFGTEDENAKLLDPNVT